MKVIGTSPSGSQFFLCGGQRPRADLELQVQVKDV